MCRLSLIHIYYLFQIDSIEETPDAYMITYRAATDEQNYSGYYDMQLKVNGVIFHYDDFTFADEDRTSNSMLGGGPDRPIQVTLPRTLLAHAGIQEITSLEFEMCIRDRSGGCCLTGREGLRPYFGAQCAEKIAL